MTACDGMTMVNAAITAQAEGLVPLKLPKINTKAIPLQPTIHLFINWLIGLTFIPGVNQAIMGFF